MTALRAQTRDRLGEGALAHGQGGGDALHQEGGHLHLLVGVEGGHADVA
eukprot:CAMPEP_0117656410 /NCGR_PEP_ID=MMETSP0804-20121206/4790_1 /TAXON_ID=1074897 /ORGANISM="Tetraselmis astigmatica, Strain CCMP880" /LENGTH=48 /DNA_ID= /DNA_START= /DNA_END= /DNA_ORIENTATION=